MRNLKLALTMLCVPFSSTAFCAEYRQLIDNLATVADVDGFVFLHPAVEVNQPKGTLSLTVVLEISAPVIQQFHYSLYEKMADEYLSWKDQRTSFFARFHLRSPTALLIRFPSGVHGTAGITLPGSVRQLEADGKGEIRIAANRVWKKIDPLILLNAMPEKIEVVTD